MSAIVKPLMTAAELRALVLAELGDDCEPDAVLIVQTGSTWCATLRSDGSRLDEEMLASVSAVRRRLSAGYSLRPE